MMNFYRLQDILPISELEQILQHFCTATDLITICSDFRGVMLTSEARTTLYTPFCKRLRLTNCPLGKLCEACDANGSLEAARRGKPFIYRCHMGFVEASAPIVVNDMYLGAILMGQVKTEPDIMRDLPRLSDNTSLLESDPELKALYLSSLECATFVPHEKLKAFAGLMACTANFIAQLATNHFMQDKLNSRRIEMLEAQNRKAAIEKDMAFLRLKNLKMRIHPHYLFNTLNIINGLAVLEDAPQTSEAIGALSNTLRFTLRKHDDLIPLRKELECVESYLAIQRLVYDKRVTFITQAEERCLDALVPLFMLQLIVENACLHGFSSTTINGLFELDVRQIGDRIHVNAQDNGSGIDPATAKDLNAYSPQPLSDESDTSGLTSLMSYLRYYYGEKSSWDIERIPEGGTHLHLSFPILYQTSDLPDQI